MPKPLGTILNHIATVAGVKSDNPDLVAILTNPELSKIQVPDEISTVLESNLMSEASATAKVGAKLKAEALNGVDVHIKRFVETELGLDPTLLTELESERNTGKRVELLVKKIKEIEAAKAKLPEGDKAELTKQINELKQAKAALEQVKAQEIEGIKSQHDQELTKMYIRQQLSGIKMPDAYKDLAPELKMSLLENALNSEMVERKVKVVRKDGRLELVQEDGTDYFDKNVKVDFKGFVDATTSKHNLVATADTVDPQKKVIVGGGSGDKNVDIIQSIDAQLAELSAASKS